MRNLTKVLAMVLALTMMVSVVGFAANYTDVEDGANYAEAVKVLSDLGLVQGMGDGTFGAELNLTRAQGVAFVIRLMGLEETAVSNTGLDTGFNDVPAGHWASGYIYTGVQKGIIEGNGDGTFAPDAELTFAQIVKMVVVALGYQPLAAELGEWPGNYTTAATQIKLTKGIAGQADATVTRATTARILYAALTIPKMEKKGVGVNALWEPRNTLILDDLGFYKMIGKITAVDLVNGDVNVTITKQGRAIDGEYKETNTDMDITSGPYDIGAFGAELKNYINIDAQLYFAYIGREYTLVSIVEDVKNVDTINLKSSDVDKYDDTIKEVTYFTNAEQTKDDEFKLADTVSTYKNGGTASSVAADDFNDEYLADASQEYVIEIKDTDGDGKFDYAIVTDYAYMVVKDIDVSKSGVYTIKSETVSDMFNSKIVIDTDDDNDALVKIIKDGKEISVADIAVGDTLNIVTTEAGGSTALKVATIYVTNDTVEGVVKYADTTDKFASIGGEEYSYIVADSTVAATAEGTFYLNILGQIFYADDEVVTAAYDYGFATTVDFDIDAGTAEAGTITILTTEGEWATLDLAGKVTVKKNTSSNIYNLTNSTYDPDSADWNGMDGAPHDVTDSKEQKVYINGMVAYKLNSAGAVKEVLVNASAMANANITNSIGLNKTYKVYEDEDSMFGGYTVTEGTVVYNLVADWATDHKVKADEIEVTDLSIFNDDQDYTADLYNINQKTFVPAIMVGTFVADLDFASNWFIVTSSYDVLHNDEVVTQLTGYFNGDEVVYYYISGESEVYAAGASAGEVANTSSEVTTFAKGDVLIVKANAENEIVKGSKLGTVTDLYTGTTTAVNFSNLDNDVFSAVVSGEADSKFIKGFIVKAEGSKVYVAFDGSQVNAGVIEESLVNTFVQSNDPYIYRDNTVVTVYDLNASSKNTVSAGDESDLEAGTAVFARVDEYNRIVEVVVVVTETEY